MCHTSLEETHSTSCDYTNYSQCKKCARIQERQNKCMTKQSLQLTPSFKKTARDRETDLTTSVFIVASIGQNTYNDISLSVRVNFHILGE